MTRARAVRIVAQGLLVGAALIIVFALMVGCGPKDEHRQRCEDEGGVVGTQYDHNHNVKAHTCLVHGKVVDVWSLPAPTPEPNWQ